MDSDIPRNTAYIQELTLPDSANVTYNHRELSWQLEEASTHGEPIAKIKDEEILFIVDESREPQNGYLIVCLAEIVENTSEPFQLALFRAPRLPQDVLQKHLLKGIPEALRAEKLHVVVSTRSGLGLAQQFYSQVLRKLLDIVGSKTFGQGEPPVSSHAASARPGTHDLIVTKSSSSIKEFARELHGHNANHTPEKVSNESKHTVILLSGDGGVVDMLNGAQGVDSTGSRVTLALMPLGTGNALFHSLHKPHYTAEDGSAPSPLVLGLRTLFKGSASPLPTFQVSFSSGSKLVSYSAPGASDSPEDLEEHTQEVHRLYGAIVASYGFHAQLVWESDTPEYRKHGDKRFGMVAQELLKTSHAYSAAVEVIAPGGRETVKLERDRHNYVLVAMVSNLERTFTISPASRPLDGRLRLVHFGAVGGEKTMQIMMQAYKEGSHIGTEWTDEDGKKQSVGYDEVGEVKVTILEEDSRWRKVCIDGTIVEVPHDGWMSVKKAAESGYSVLIH